MTKTNNAPGGHVDIPPDEAHKRLEILVGDLHAFLLGKAEQPYIVLDALLNTYVQVAANCGLVHKTPKVLRMMADRVKRILSTNSDVTAH